MSDLLVRLYDLPDLARKVAVLKRKRIGIRRVLPPEQHLVTTWVGCKFSAGWGGEVTKAMANTPVSCFIATRGKQLLGFACYDATCRGYFGPTGVDEAARGQGVGTALLWVTLQAMAEAGYAYAVIGWAGPVAFYRRTVNAIVIPGSSPGIYRGLLTDRVLKGVVSRPRHGRN